MSIHIDALRDIAANHGWPVCDEAADEIEVLERAYALLFEANGKLRTQLEALEARNTQPPHSVEDCYQHFLSYMGEADTPLLRKAYFDGADSRGTQAAREPAKKRYDRLMVGSAEFSPIERLRFFLSLALTGQDWLDVEPFIDALACPAPLAAPAQSAPEPVIPSGGADDLLHLAHELWAMAQGPSAVEDAAIRMVDRLKEHFQAQAAQEPVAWMKTDADGENYFAVKPPKGLGDWRWSPLYTRPAAIADVVEKTL